MVIRDIIVFSHLRWNFVFQRPQHLLSRLARGRRVLFIEEPVRGDGTDHWQKHRSEDMSVTVCTPVTSVDRPGFCAAQMPALRALMASLMEQEQPRSSALWFYTPMALPLAEGLHPAVTVYDCMDELTGFVGAPPELADMEAELFRKADVAFTGGRSLYEA